MSTARTLGAVAALTAAIGCVGDASTATGDRAAPSQQPFPEPTPAVADHSAFVAAVDALAADAMRQGPIAGLSIAVSQAGVPILAKGYGLADVESGVPATAETS